ncbi:MAG: glycosyltransferase [Candidatus Woesearchaeota archaeon]
MDFGIILIYVMSYFGLFTGIYFLLTLFENKNKIKKNLPFNFNFPSVSIIVPAFNEEKTIAKTLKSLLNLNYPKDKLQIIVVDDGSTDKTYKIAFEIKKRYKAKNLEIYKKENGGKGTALNYGLKKAKGYFVGALDADSFVDKNALLNILPYFYIKDYKHKLIENKKVMAVTPSLKVYEPKSILQRIQMIEYMIGIFLRKVFSFLGSIHVTPGPFTIYRKEFFEKYGYYDENNITEDIEIALRIQKNNFEIENSINAYVYTVAPYNFKPLLNQRLRWYLGFIENVLNYKELFSPKQGNLGLIVLPSAFISVFLLIVMFFYTLYKFFETTIKNLINYYNINFDLLKIFKINTDLFYINLNGYILISFITLIISLVILIISSKISKENINIKRNYLLYILFYWMLFSIWWLYAIFAKIFGKNITWGKKKYEKQKSISEGN